MKRINASKCLVALLISLTALCGYAQDSYREALKEYFRLNGQIGQIESALKALNGTLFDDGGNVDLNQLTDRYIKERMSDFFAGSMESKMKERNVTEADLREVIELLSTPAGKAYNEHQQAWIDNIKEELPSVMLQNMGQIMYGDTSNPIQPKADIDAGYINKFKEVMGSSIVESFMNAFDMTTPATKSVQLPEGLKDGLQKWLNVNMPTMMMNCAYGTITVDDLDFAAMLGSHESYRKVQDFSSFNFNGIFMVSDMLSNYINWMQNQGAVVRGGASDIIKMIFDD